MKKTCAICGFRDSTGMMPWDDDQPSRLYPACDPCRAPVVAPALSTDPDDGPFVSRALVLGVMRAIESGQLCEIAAMLHVPSRAPGHSLSNLARRMVRDGQLLSTAGRPAIYSLPDIVPARGPAARTPIVEKVEVLVSNGVSCPHEMRSQLGCVIRTVREALGELVDQGKVAKIKNGVYRRAA